MDVSGRKSRINCNSARHPTVTNSKQRQIWWLKKPCCFLFFLPQNKVDWPFRCSHVAKDSDLLYTVCTVFSSTACTHQPPGAVPWQERLVRGQEHHADSRAHGMSASLHSEQVRMKAFFPAAQPSGVWDVNVSWSGDLNWFLFFFWCTHFQCECNLSRACYCETFIL